MLIDDWLRGSVKYNIIVIIPREGGEKKMWTFSF